mgnify:CR=1 FL=1
MVNYEKFRVAAAHAAPIYHDRSKTVEKACKIIEEAAEQGVHLIAFPESFIPGFPIWAMLAAPIRTHHLFAELASQAIRINGPEIERIRAVARKHRIIVSMGFTEGTQVSVGCLWNSNVLIGADGSLLNHHRKIVPTFFEKLVWASGDGSGLRVTDTEIGRVGMLICGENGNPLARYSLIAQGEQIHVSTYPAMAPMRPLKETGGYDLEQAIRIRAAGHSFEGKVFNIVASTFYDETLRNALAPLGEDVVELLDKSPKAVSMILAQSGSVVGATRCAEEGLVIADIDLSPAVELKRLHDVVGYYNRYDIFHLSVNRSPQHPIHFFESAEGLSFQSQTMPKVVDAHIERARKNEAAQLPIDPPYDPEEVSTPRQR